MTNASLPFLNMITTSFSCIDSNPSKAGRSSPDSVIMFALYSFKVAGLSLYLTPMGIVASSVLGALPAPTPLTRKVLARLWYFVLCPCRAAANDMARAVSRPTMFSRDPMSTSIECLPLGSFVLVLRFSMAHTVESSSLLSLVGMSSLVLSVVVARLSMNAYSDSLQPVFIQALKSSIVALCSGSSGQSMFPPLLSRSNVVSCRGCERPGGTFNEDAACGGVLSYPV